MVVELDYKVINLTTTNLNYKVMEAKEEKIILDCSEILKPVEERIKQLHLDGDRYKYYRAGMINTLDAVIAALKELNIPQLVIKK